MYKEDIMDNLYDKSVAELCRMTNYTYKEVDGIIMLKQGDRVIDCFTSVESVQEFLILVITITGG